LEPALPRSRRTPPLCIRKLRKKIAAATGGQHYIETVWGRGYVLKDPEVPGEQKQVHSGPPVPVHPSQAAVA
jgi:DNA-binding winged helix-turn-helix (wHTH) protein